MNKPILEKPKPPLSVRRIREDEYFCRREDGSIIFEPDTLKNRIEIYASVIFNRTMLYICYGCIIAVEAFLATVLFMILWYGCSSFINGYGV